MRKVMRHRQTDPAAGTPATARVAQDVRWTDDISEMCATAQLTDVTFLYQLKNKIHKVTTQDGRYKPNELLNHDRLA